MSDKEQAVQKYQQTSEALQSFTPDVVLDQIQMIQDLMERAMQENEHYGLIPGCGNKPTLLKAGAEKLNFTFRLSPSYDVIVEDFAHGHREYRITCTLTHIESGLVWGQGVGSCSTLESKYRYRNQAAFEVTGLPIPPDAKEKKAAYRKKGFGMKLIAGSWEWVKYGQNEKVENSDIADAYNTVLKMAKKRAHVDATLTVTAASDIFTQDLEELPEIENADFTVTNSTPANKKPAAGPAEQKRQQQKKKKEVHPKQKLLNAKKWFFGKTKKDDLFYELVNKAGYEHESKIPEDQLESVLAAMRVEMDKIIKKEKGE